MDRRYSINKEYCGYAKKRFVVRFCGTFISSHDNCADATGAVKKHMRERHKEIEIEELPKYEGLTITDHGSENVYFVHMGQNYFCKLF